MAEHNTVSAFGVAPRQGAFGVADHVAGAALKALLVVEQDSAVAGGNEKFCGARDHTRFGRAASADIGFDDDVRLV